MKQLKFVNFLLTFINILLTFSKCSWSLSVVGGNDAQQKQQSAHFYSLPTTEGGILLQEGFRFMQLPEEIARKIAELMIKRNISIFIEFKQALHNKGSLLSIYGGYSKALELYSDGMKAEFRIHWRRESSLSSNIIQNIDFDDNSFHKLIFDFHGNHVSVTKDCREAVLDGDYSEIDFSLLNRSKPSVWITQRGATDGLLVGRLLHFKVKEGSFYSDVCQGGSGAGMTTRRPPSESHESMKQDLHRMKDHVSSLEAELNKWRPFISKYMQADLATLPLGGALTTTTTDSTGAPPVPTTPHESKGVCPNCYEFVLHKATYLENEFKRWRESIQKMEGHIRRILLFQRGCKVNNTYHKDGESWTQNCVECVCNMGKPLCKLVGCQTLPCAKPLKTPDRCCPICGQSCFYMQKTYEHGAVFYPKPCVRCQCNNGDAHCSHMPKTCPTLSCPQELQVTPENLCCPVCANSDFCASNPCHPNAVCVNKPHEHRCECKPGYFGDGQESCYDIDECKPPNDDHHHRVDSGQTTSSSSSDQQSVKEPDKNNGQGHVTVDDSKEEGETDQSESSQHHHQSHGPCGAGARCINLPGSYQCECLPGYVKINNNTCFDSIVHE